MKAVIPVAGRGTRLRPLTHVTPKPMLRVAGKPVIQHIVERIQTLPGLEGIHLVISPWMEEVPEFVKTIARVPVTYSVQEDPQGLGHAVYMAREAVQPDEAVFIILGDTIVDRSFDRDVAEGRDFVAVIEVEDPRRFGVVELNEAGEIVRMVEKPQEPPSNLAIAGVYFIQRAGFLFEALDHIIRHNIRTASQTGQGEFQLTDALQWMLDQGWRPVPLRLKPENWLDCGTMEALLATNATLLKRMFPTAPEKQVCNLIIPPVLIEPGAQIEGSIVGPYVYVEKCARIRHSIVRNSIIYTQAEVEYMVLLDSVVGENTELRGHHDTLRLAPHSQYHRRNAER